jgi:S-adenosylmethionine-diacylgycerolhomoserine-N-methlytransferase
MTPSVVAATTDMNNMYRWQRHFYDLTRKYYLLGRDRMIDRLDAAPGHAVLEIGCGTARNLIVAARANPQVAFFGIDVSTEMLETAIKQIARAGLQSRISVAYADAVRFDPRLSFGRAGFERVFMSYCLSMIPDWRTAIDTATSLLAIDGELHIVDFGEQEALPAWLGRGLRRWLAAFDVVPRHDLYAYLTERALSQNAGLRFERPYLGYAQYAVFRRTAHIGAQEACLQEASPQSVAG